MKESSYEHIIFYAKGHYKRDNTIDDLKRLIQVRSGVDIQYITLFNVVTVLFNAYEEIRGGERIPEHCFRELLLENLNPDSIMNKISREPLKPYPERLISGLLSKIATSRVKNERGEPIIVVSSPDPDILPLSEE